MLSLVDYIGDPLLSWLPLFYLFKCALIVYLTVPDFEVWRFAVDFAATCHVECDFIVAGLATRVHADCTLHPSV